MAKQTVTDIKSAIQAKPAKSFNSLLREYGEIALELEEGEYTEEMEARLQANKEDFEDKLLGMFYVIEANKSKIEDFYKPEIQAFTSRIKRLENVNDRLKKNSLAIVELFGVENKIKTLALNCTKVVKDSLEVSVSEFEERCNEVIKAIRYNNLSDIKDNEADCYQVQVQFKNISIDAATKLYAAIKNYIDIEEIPEPEIKITLDKKLALERVIQVENYNKGLKVRKDSSLFDDKHISEEDYEANKLSHDLAGCSLGETVYPLFS